MRKDEVTRRLHNKKQSLTNLSVKDLFLSVANWFNDFEEGLEKSEVTQPPGFIVELLPLCFLQAGKNNSLCYKPLHFCFSPKKNTAERL